MNGDLLQRQASYTVYHRNANLFFSLSGPSNFLAGTDSIPQISSDHGDWNAGGVLWKLLQSTGIHIRINKNKNKNPFVTKPKNSRSGE